MNKLVVPGNAVRLMAGLLAGFAAGTALGAECAAPSWDGRLPVLAPVLEPGVVWSYSPGAEWPLTRMRLEKVDGSRATYRINDSVPYREIWTTYTDVNAGRDGEKLILHFPLRPGDSWTDKFTEPGVFRNRYEHYLYDYEESATSTVAGVEDITVAAGTFRTIRVDRVAHWVKSEPQAIDGTARAALDEKQPPEADGYTLTQLWYAPSLGRAVLKASLRVGDEAYARAAVDLLRNAKSAVVELVAYQAEGVACGGGQPLRARQPEMYVPLGYAVIPTDTWEWALRMREHMPLRETIEETQAQ